MAITLDGTNGITTPDVIATSQSSNFVTTGNISAADLTLTGAASATDLTLSGGVYLGGPVSANLLDDYEEGTWTPTLTDGSTTISGGSILGTYTKIGRLVHTRFSFINPTTNLGLSGTWQISNLPFSIQGQSNEYIGGFVTYNRNISMSGNWMSLWSFTNASYFQLRSHYMNGTESSSKGGTVPAQMLFSGEMIYHTS